MKKPGFGRVFFWCHRTQLGMNEVIPNDAIGAHRTLGFALLTPTYATPGTRRQRHARPDLCRARRPSPALVAGPVPARSNTHRDDPCRIAAWTYTLAGCPVPLFGPLIPLRPLKHRDMVWRGCCPSWVRVHAARPSNGFARGALAWTGVLCA